MEKKYKWSLESFAKGIDPDYAVKELERIEILYGSLTPEHILDASKDKNALFNSLFTWDDCEAAKLYRLQQARKILNNIEIEIISDNESRVIPVYEVVTQHEGRAYKHIQNMTAENINEIKVRTIKELNALRNKLSTYSKFEKVIQKLDEAVGEMDSISED